MVSLGMDNRLLVIIGY